MNIKYLSLVIPLSSVVISGLYVVAVMKTAQGQTSDILTQPSGQMINLVSLDNNDQQQELRDMMNAQELFEQGRAFGKQNLYEEAGISFTQAIAIDPNFAEAYAFRANLRILQDNPQGAIEDFQKALEIFEARGDLVLANSMQESIEGTREEFRLGK